jgi:hypothetical protein
MTRQARRRTQAEQEQRVRQAPVRALARSRPERRDPAETLSRANDIAAALRAGDTTAALRLVVGAEREFLTAREVQYMLQISPRTLVNYDRRGILPGYRIKTSRLLRYKREDVLKLIEETPFAERRRLYLDTHPQTTKATATR